MAFRSNKKKNKARHDSAVKDTAKKSSTTTSSTQKKNTVATTDDSSVELKPNYPAWMGRFYERHGYLAGMGVWLAGMVVCWPLIIMIIAGAVHVLAVVMVPVIPDMVLDGLVATPMDLLTSSDKFLFNWVMPTLFMVIVGSLLVTWLIKLALRWCADYSVRSARGLFSGHGETWSDNRFRRRLTKEKRRKQRKDDKEAKAADKKRRKEQLEEAKKSQEASDGNEPDVDTSRDE